MQIEKTFRDLKSSQYGMGLRQSRSRCPRRYDVLLLIALLAEILLCSIGLATQHLGWLRRFQANTICDRNVLSVLRLGKEVRRRPEYSIKESHFRWVWGGNFLNGLTSLEGQNYEGTLQRSYKLPKEAQRNARIKPTGEARSA